MPAPPDRELVERARSGDHRAFGGLIERYQDDLFRYALHMGFDEFEARDILQDALIRAYRHLDRCGDPDRFDGWLFRITSNLCRTAGARRSRRITARLDDVTLVDESADPSSRVEAHALGRAVEEALDTLPEEQRETVVLFYMHGRSVREIAATLQVSGSAVKMRLKRARDALKDLLEPLSEQTG